MVHQPGRAGSWWRAGARRAGAFVLLRRAWPGPAGDLRERGEPARAPVRPWPIFPAASGPVYVATTFRGGFQYGKLRDPSYHFAYAGDLAGNKAPPFLYEQDGNSLWIAVRHQGTVDYDVQPLTSVFQTVLVQLRMP